MDYNKNGQPVQAYPVATEAQAPYNPQQQQQQQQPQQYYNGQPIGATVAQPYNGPTGQQAHVGQAEVQRASHVVVVRQGQGGAGPAQHPPPDYCLLSWFSCICCCPLLGIFAICMASSVQSKWRHGDFEGAARASAMAKRLSILAIIIGLISAVATTMFEVPQDSNNFDDDNGATGGGSFNNP